MKPTISRKLRMRGDQIHDIMPRKKGKVLDAFISHLGVELEKKHITKRGIYKALKTAQIWAAYS